MKRNLSVILLTVPFIFFYSCNTPNNYRLMHEFSDVKAKTTYRSFDHLNEPIVFMMQIDDTYALFGKSKKHQYKQTAGDIFVIYDWENDEIFDWVYYDGYHSYTSGRACEQHYNDRISYYSSPQLGEIIVELNPLKTELSKYTKEYTSNGCNNFFTTGRYFTLYDDLYINNNDEKQHLKIYAFDTEEKRVLEKPFDMPTAGTWTTYPECDSNGKFYVKLDSIIPDDYSTNLYQIDFSKNDNAKLIYTLPKNLRYDETLKRDIMDNWDLIGVINDYVFLIDSSASGSYSYNKETFNIVVLSLKTNAVVQNIKINSSDIRFSSRIMFFDGKYHALFCSNEKENLFYISSFDVGEDFPKIQTSKLNVAFEGFYPTYNSYQRGSRHYMIHTWLDTTNIQLTYYDFETNQLGKIKNITLEDVISCIDKKM